jgi:hypothetical protein
MGYGSYEPSLVMASVCICHVDCWCVAGWWNVPDDMAVRMHWWRLWLELWSGVYTSMLRPTLDGVQGPNLDSFESNWIIVLDPSLHLGSFKSWALLFSSFFGSNQLIFLPKCCHVNLALICRFLVLDSHLKDVGPIYSLSSNRIVLFFFDPGWRSSSKVTLRKEDMKKMVFGIRA